MENNRTCPICKEVPEAEIFQCSTGHVICQSCISKVVGRRCPQCMVSFGTQKIRNRALEEILDAQNFECKFKDNGCSQLCKRGELTSHENSCSHNPDTVPLCQLMGIQDCEFRLGCKSKAEVIKHFGRKHIIGTTITSSLSLSFPSQQLLTLLSRKRKFCSSTMPKVDFGAIVSSDELDTGHPLFMVHGKMNKRKRSWSFGCIKIWDSGSHATAKYNANFNFVRDDSPNPTQGQSSTSTSTMTGNHPFPFGGTLTVYNLKDAHHLIKESPINIPHSILEKNKFGSTSLDTLQVNITQASVSS